MGLKLKSTLVLNIFITLVACYTALKCFREDANILSSFWVFKLLEAKSLNKR